jgi:hypothetical protein
LEIEPGSIRFTIVTADTVVFAALISLKSFLKKAMLPVESEDGAPGLRAACHDAAHGV